MGHTGSSALVVLLKVEEAELTSSIMLVKSWAISLRRSERRSASLYLQKVSLSKLGANM